MRLGLVLAWGAVAGIAAASPRLGSGRPLSFEIGVLVGAALGGALFGYLVGRAFGWLR
jgi:hypothetical protein